MAGHCSLSPPSTPHGSSAIPLSFRIAGVRLLDEKGTSVRTRIYCRVLPEKVKDFAEVSQFASVVTLLEIAFVRLHIYNVTCFSACDVSASGRSSSAIAIKGLFKSPFKWRFPILIKKFTTILFFCRWGQDWILIRSFYSLIGPHCIIMYHFSNVDSVATSRFHNLYSEGSPVRPRRLRTIPVNLLGLVGEFSGDKGKTNSPILQIPK